MSRISLPSPEQMDSLWERGWRHFGPIFYRYREAITPETVKTDAMFISFIQPPKTRLLFSEDKAETKKAAAAAPRARVIQTAPVTRRFLFTRTDAENKAFADRRAALRRRRHVDR